MLRSFLWGGEQANSNVVLQPHVSVKVGALKLANLAFEDLLCNLETTNLHNCWGEAQEPASGTLPGMSTGQTTDEQTTA